MHGTWGGKVRQCTITKSCNWLAESWALQNVAERLLWSNRSKYRMPPHDFFCLSRESPCLGWEWEGRWKGREIKEKKGEEDGKICGKCLEHSPGCLSRCVRCVTVRLVCHCFCRHCQQKETESSQQKLQPFLSRSKFKFNTLCPTRCGVSLESDRNWFVHMSVYLYCPFILTQSLEVTRGIGQRFA